jgi:archaellum component FlaC
MGRVKEAMTGIGGSLGQQENEWKAAIGDLHKNAKPARSEASGLKEMLGNLEGKYEQLQAAVTGQGDELAEIRRRNEELGDLVQQLEEENHRLRDSSEGLKGELARVEAGQQNAVVHLQEEIAAGGSKVEDDLSNVQGELAKLKEEIKRMKMTAKQFPPSVKKGKYFDLPNGITAHLTRECGGNVHDRHVVDVTCGSLEKETCGANPHSGAFDNRPDCAAKNAADLESHSQFFSAYRYKKEDIPHTRNNWLCYDFNESRIVPTHYTIRTFNNGPGLQHLKSWLVETSADGKSWREVAREEDNGQLNGKLFAGTFAVADGGECHFIRLVNIGRNHYGDDRFLITAWEIFGSLFE